jgi:hypothetical protein
MTKKEPNQHRYSQLGPSGLVADLKRWAKNHEQSWNEDR